MPSILHAVRHVSGRPRFLSRVVALLLAGTLLPLSQAASQELKVGDPAPDFTVTTVTASGPDAKPFRLSDHRGETVILAFFPQAGTSGCTTQMEGYRDRYAAVFKGGDKVTLVGVSTDSEKELVEWAREKRFPFRFAADGSKAVAKAYGASSMLWHKRHLYVIDPAGRIAYIARPFRQMADEAYTELGQAIAASRPR